MYTNWTEPNQAYEQALSEFIRRVMTDSDFLKEFFPLYRKVSLLGMWTSLSQTVLKLTSPGMPDIYQGQELWDFSLVDPDNRRPVDYGIRKGHMVALQQKVTSCRDGNYSELVSALTNYMQDGIIKMYIIQAILHLRKRLAEMFKSGEYVPLKATGDRQKNIVAYARKDGKSHTVIIVGRFFSSLIGPNDNLPTGAAVWGNTSVELDSSLFTGEAFKYRDIFTGACYPQPNPTSNPSEAQFALQVSNLFSLLPFTVLESIPV
jgi:(1->4)-alpha-D-glucan 1-alpha-D-glucosylmutase